MLAWPGYGWLGQIMTLARTVLGHWRALDAQTRATIFICFLAVLIGVCAFFSALDHHPSAYQWPALDMFPYFMIRAGEANLATDFFSQCSLLPSPRHIFGGLVTDLSSITHIHWYRALSLIQSAIGVATPVAMFVALISILRLFLPSVRSIVVAAAALAAPIIWSLVNPNVSAALSVAWWPSMLTEATPLALSELLGAIAIPFALNRRILRFSIGCVVLFVAVLIHPTVGLSAVGLASVVLLLVGSWAFAGILVIIGGAAATILLILFGEHSGIGAVEFVQVYVVRAHPWHFLPSQFGVLYVPDFLRETVGVHWYTGLLIVLLGLAATAGLFYRSKDYKVAQLCTVLVALLSGILVLQYFFVELIPVKMVATLGPVTAFLWNFWFFCMAVALLCTFLFGDLRRAHKTPQMFSLLQSPGQWGAAAVGGGVIAGLVLLLFVVTQDAMTDVPMTRDGPAFAWIETHTSPDSVFVAPLSSNFSIDIPIVTHRAVFFGNGFPFTERCLREYYARDMLVTGTPEQVAAAAGDDVLARFENLYDSHSAQYFVSLRKRYRADYVIVKSKVAGNFSTIAPAYRNANYAIYSIDALARAQTAK